jgi:hypothetical protein
MRNRGSGTSRRSCPLVGPNVITPLTGVTDSATSTRRPGMSLTGLHHDCKAAAEDFVESVSGTNGIAGAADTIILISRPRNETQGLLKVTGRDVVEGEYAVTIQDGVWELMGESLESAAQAAVTLRATADLGNRSAEILRLVNKHPEGVRAGQVAEALADIDAKEAGTYLGRLFNTGKIRKADRGFYAPVESVESVGNEGTSRPGFHTSNASNTTSSCTVCGFPLHASLIAAGETIHPNCEQESDA